MVAIFIGRSFRAISVIINRLGKYTKNGNEYVRVEIANSIYFANYSVSATDRGEGTMEMEHYKGWTYTEGEMLESTTSQMTTVLQPGSLYRC